MHEREACSSCHLFNFILLLLILCISQHWVLMYIMEKAWLVNSSPIYEECCFYLDSSMHVLGSDSYWFSSVLESLMLHQFRRLSRCMRFSTRLTLFALSPDSPE